MLSEHLLLLSEHVLLLWEHLLLLLEHMLLLLWEHVLAIVCLLFALFPLKKVNRLNIKINVIFTFCLMYTEQ